MTDSLVKVTSKQQFDDLLSSSRIVVADCEHPAMTSNATPPSSPEIASHSCLYRICEKPLTFRQMILHNR